VVLVIHSELHLGGNDLALGGSFGCKNPALVSSGYGKIAAIGADYIEC
jgi:hypothetical protein